MDDTHTTDELAALEQDTTEACMVDCRVIYAVDRITGAQVEIEARAGRQVLVAGDTATIEETAAGVVLATPRSAVLLSMAQFEALLEDIAPEPRPPEAFRS